MSKYVIKYEKNTTAKYISHLDFLRTIGRALRRAGVQLKYSEGFNPHPHLSFAAPLSVGIESSCELFSAELKTDIPEAELVDSLNAALPPCIRIISATREPLDFNLIASADYEIATEFAVTEEQIRAFLAAEEIFVEKKTKKGIKQADIRKDIFNICVNDNVMLMTLAAGNSGSLKPTLAVLALSAYTGASPGFCRYKRICFRNAAGKEI